MRWEWLIALGAVALAALAAASVWWWRRRRRRRLALEAPPRLVRKLRYPVVLAHGIMGFNDLKIPGIRSEYFRGVPPRLRQLGAQVHAVKVSPFSSVKDRAAELARSVRELDARRVNIIAHSMGGLDARYAITKLGLGDKVASLITIGTPHRGTPLADLGTNVLGDRLKLKGMLTMLGLDVDAIYDLTTTRMESFNREIEDAPGVLYGSYLARTQGKALALNPLLLPSYLYLSEQAGENDGLVPTTSQRWGEILGQVEADHWAQIGWSPRFDAPAFYAGLLRELTARGV